MSTAACRHLAKMSNSQASETGRQVVLAKACSLHRHAESRTLNGLCSSDVDGTLIDTLENQCRVWHTWATHHELDPVEVYQVALRTRPGDTSVGDGADGVHLARPGERLATSRSGLLPDR